MPRWFARKTRITVVLCLWMALLLCVSACAPRVAAPVPDLLVSPSTLPDDVKPARALPVEEPTPTPSPTPTQPPEVRVQLAGDILLHTKPTRAAATGENSYDFSPYFKNIAPYLNGDVVICNVETPIDVKGGNVSLSSYPTFNAPFEILPALKDAGVTHAVNANNHCFDKGWAGLKATRENFEKAQLPVTGTSRSQKECDDHLIIDAGGIKIGLIAYTDAVNGLESLIPETERGFAVRRFSSASLKDVPDMISDMEACREAGAEFIILSLHWGAEYQDKPSQTQREIAEALCASGADILMGSHPHCVQPIEWMPGLDGRRSLCIYSLGNFFADQNDLSPKIPKTQYAALVSAVLRKNPDGTVEIRDADVLPTFTYRFAKEGAPNGLGYLLLPAFAHKDGNALNDLLLNEKDRARCEEAWNHVTSLVAEDVPVFSQE